MSNAESNSPSNAVPAPSQTAAPQPARAREILSSVLMLVILYIVMTPPLVYSAARTGVLRDISTDDPSFGPMSACIAPARWVYEDSPLKPVLQPWAEFWYNVLLT
ncbi:MAG: hypothetical protein AB7O26_21165 [Planctomycetaceae bacterium]